jgi:H+/Cl- antiporter ClcA
MRFLAIILLTICAAIVYGIIHDQVTARICVEYFTIGHPKVIESESPTQLALVWGVLATWWVGLILGVPLAMCSRIGQRPKLTAIKLVRPITILLICMGALAALVGMIGYELAGKRAIVLLEPLASEVPVEKHQAFLADGAAHLASYGAGFIGGIILCIWAWRYRAKTASEVSDSVLIADNGH